MDTKQLRQKILDLAIRGKLVPQDPNNEPASVLLARVKAEKERLIAEGKIKRSKKTATTTDKPHYADWNLPSGWVWVKLEDIAIDMADGPFGSNLKSSHYKTDRVVLIIQLSNIGEYGWRDDNVRYTTFEHAKDIQRSIVDSGDIVIAKMMPAGRAIICPNKDKAYVLSSDAVKLKPSSLLNISYLLYAINSPLFQNQVNENVQGVTRLRTSIAKLKSYAFPLPPLNEQTRIVNSLVHYLSIIDNIQDSIESINGGIVQVKSKILELAISGKLVAQDPSDEPAADLLQRVNPNAIVSTDKSHYGQLPDGWCYTTMNFICHLYDGEKVENKELINLDAKYLRGKSEGNTLNKGRFVPENTTMILVDGENSGEIFTAPINGYQGSTFKLLDISEEMNAEYVKMIIRIYQKRLRDNKVGSAIPHLNKKMFREILIPVPPIAEQLRIVERTNELMSKITELTEAL